VSLKSNKSAAAESVRQFLVQYQISVLNVAGPRESEDPGVGEFTRRTMEQALKR
jgi:hypothetical protein